MENNLRTKLIDEARKNGSKFGKKAELDFGAGAEWMYNKMQKQLTLTDVVLQSEQLNFCMHNLDLTGKCFKCGEQYIRKEGS
jgi:hypothetical protein